jgi:hypothetical protein
VKAEFLTQSGLSSSSHPAFPTTTSSEKTGHFGQQQTQNTSTTPQQRQNNFVFTHNASTSLAVGHQSHRKSTMPLSAITAHNVLSP